MSSAVEPTTGKARNRRRAAAAAAVLVAGGAVTGGVLASTLGASAASSPAPAASGSAGSSSAPSKPGLPWDGPRPTPRLTGTVTAVGADTIGIKTSTATTTYSVTSATVIVKPPAPTTASPNFTPPKAGSAKATLADVKVGDTVSFSTTTAGGTVLAQVIDGLLPGARGFGPNHGIKPLTGTVTAVGATTVGIKTSTGTATYSVTSATTIAKFATGSLDGVKVGDTVSFATTTVGGTVLAHLEDGVLAGPGGFGRRGGPGGPGGQGGPGGPGGFGGMHGPRDGGPAAPLATPSASPAAQA
jgi:hypothetical protein